MNIQKVTAFFMWCTIINGVLLVLSLIIGIAGLDLAYSTQGKLFPISRDFFNMAYYSLLGLYKIIWIVFNVVPYVAMLIIRNK
ncbi:MAG: hypothetical protein GX654_12665 [Desulfatiglans sp.]|jgi:hypothetical protein|nr:hypothetical protein [Desulfatiglans sp.]